MTGHFEQEVCLKYMMFMLQTSLTKHVCIGFIVICQVVVCIWYFKPFTGVEYHEYR